ncbi:lytic murein transglycosylase [Rhodobium orientis]|uniref:Lytic transglycosylase n=1 Tax=Rhodobium orientis TaxID=34017 RepID=A0A327JP13_9HYPH|nr:lytic murein transglycosylase [Rhodobium orientis]MBB4304927.1 lytic murein transglycosylase [Rhodobium orientis]MBK5951246.1 lytic transglycosylase [Rhodobium orientis]RAI27084.1 lytic transglycosylase [Rhodobium orientis]
MHWMVRPIAGVIAALAFLAAPAVPALAAKCGNTSAGFQRWVDDFKKEAAANGIRQSTIRATLDDVTYARKTIRLDRNQHSFKMSLETFMQRRGANAIVAKGKRIKRQQARLFDSIERRYGVPPGVLLAIWGMETGFGGYLGNQDAISALTTLAYDCRRSAFFKNELYAALKIVQKGHLSRREMRGAGHGELGQTQFLPSNYWKYAVDFDGNGRADLIRSRPDALASTANFLKGHGWRPGAGYQPGQPNFQAIQGWNAAGVYQKAIAIIAARIDG